MWKLKQRVEREATSRTALFQVCNRPTWGRVCLFCVMCASSAVQALATGPVPGMTTMAVASCSYGEEQHYESKQEKDLETILEWCALKHQSQACTRQWHDMFTNQLEFSRSGSLCSA
jgi:hypothetical protein